MKSDEIRQSFLSFFAEKQHTVIPSSSLVPHGDPTLLLTTAGMVQIKPYFLGLAKPPNTRLASCQKCFRTTDIDSIGDAKHLTFFEMLGNFSVGDYFKKEAIDMAWEFVNQRLKIPVNRLWVTVFFDDDVSFKHWASIGFPEEKIVRLGEKDNFWGPAGDSGPCGPCSEIHYDFGEHYGCGKPDCNPGCSCGRFSEIWNLVFTQYNQDKDGSRTLLPKPNIDTGMGLERVASIMQGVYSVYDTDIFMPLRKIICALVDKDYGKDTAIDYAIRIISEHSRGIAFLIADGVLPSNEGRGYVLRRLLRKASFVGRKMGVEKAFLGVVAERVIDSMGNVYPELLNNKSFILKVIRSEEDKFIATLDAGINMVDRIINEIVKRSESHIEGKDVFRFYDTYGFPPELTAEIAKEREVSVDLDGFNIEMNRQREKARASHKFTLDSNIDSGISKVKFIPQQGDFVGYQSLECDAKIIQIFDATTGDQITSADSGKEITIVLDKIPFYGEMGGQVGDTGKITSDDCEISVLNAIGVPGQNPESPRIGITAKVEGGTISVGDTVKAQVDINRRLDIARNHTATHLLQMALRQVLGSHVAQRGSLVEPERLRFDFSHLNPVEKKQLREIQDIVNKNIRLNLPVQIRIIPYKQAIAEGAIALFEEKYGETVRVLEIGMPPVSVELCGGTHINATGEIGLLVITSESSIGTGLRRIEAVTGRAAYSLLTENLEVMEAIASQVKSSVSELPEKIGFLITQLSAERKRSMMLEKKLSSGIASELLAKAENIKGIPIISANIPDTSMLILREIGDDLRRRIKSAVIVLGTVSDDKPGFLAMVTQDLVSKGLHAGNILKQVAEITGGSGGGKADIAQAGGKDKSKIETALQAVKLIVEKACL